MWLADVLLTWEKTGEGIATVCAVADIPHGRPRNNISARIEVAVSVFDRDRDPLCHEASDKPYVIAAMIFLAKVQDPSDILMRLLTAGRPRVH